MRSSSQSDKHTKNRRLHRFLIILGLCLFCCIANGIFFFNSPFSPFAGAFTNGCFSYQPEKIQNFARFVLPPSAKNLESFCAGMQGWIATAKFEMSPEDMQGFTTQTLVKSPFSSIVDTSNFSWLLRKLLDNRQLTLYLYGKVEYPELIQEILIDTSDPTKFVVYVVVLVG